VDNEFWYRFGRKTVGGRALVGVMSETMAPPREWGEVRELDARGCLDVLVGERRAADRAEANLLAVVVHYVDLHPVTDQDAVPATFALDDRGHPLFAATQVPLAGGGTPQVTERAVEELGAALTVSYRAALSLVAETLELRYRLPRLWALVQAGSLQAWKARQVARETTRLSPAAVTFVDQHLAVTAQHNTVPRNHRAVIHEALIRCDPDIAEGREEAAATHRHVTFDYSSSTDTNATAELTATLDILDALDLDHTISDLAAQMRQLGDTDPLDIRRAHALATLAHPQHTLNIFDTTGDTNKNADTTTTPDRPNGAPNRAAGSNTTGAWRNGSPVTLYVHLTAADLATTSSTVNSSGGTAGTGECGGARVERLGALTLQLLHDWLHRTDRVTIRPVLDPTHLDPVDQHDPPDPMREAVILRDGHCVFPGCPTDARVCDLDHIDPYIPLDQGGPAGQTSMSNLACLCRRHHRLKTHTPWHYQRLPTGHYQWHSPHGHRYTTSPDPKA